MTSQSDDHDHIPPGTEFVVGETDETGWYAEDAATLGDRLSGAREAAGISRSALAQKLGVKPGTLRKWEDDLSEPRANRLQMLSGLLGVSLSWLMTGRGEGPDGPEDVVAMPADVASALAEIREIRARLETTSTQLGRLEKHLRSYIQSQQ
ncbi:helix-turn-helix transcriptional regulator [Ponticoccus sp. SC2-23]|uniref:helix-turn-helix domain-containing protein n=1 Tax=Alexandriicola marinus TaxID=2081710 RepID=UPI000FDACA4A|nr:helix-turn-helix transcriptional regulator [Alexandriicola marinus]MBM1219634.1 helix-turn-helix transcriptional regulator [Ponticoccus sp. SC6-9]MBM1223294.1 helix-turn-helix transcriptional regulator [Ponticoccus sp. SC6-15]MBM1229447.1 helix-turn-helix transcriptional regulator [Ponticoccus sp. SC6-38]MBM1232260.1 helix-turn-helix transcriptional regulator [Ponticoccus sp. SC6-45]MBM1237790.1 helix-turn-helix transcriptional regulator [Ponticoccus sp. SC6-49]MBM1241271.1 helix-turn-heli